MLTNILTKFKNSTVGNFILSVLSKFFNWIHQKAFFGVFRKIDRKFMKFLFVGALNTAFGYSVYAVFVTLHASHNVALTIQYILGVLWNFKTTGVIVFKNHDNTRIVRFFMSYVLTYSINLVCLNLLVNLGVGKYLSQAIMVLPMAILSFIIFKTFVFKVKNKGIDNANNAL